MTYCLGIKVKAGLVAMADTRITSGTESTSAKKISMHYTDHGALFIMTSGLRSIRDKAVTYFEEVMEDEGRELDRMYKVVNSFGAQLRKVAQEDKASLASSGLSFNLFAIVGGQLANDKEHKLYLIYPEGNWIEIGQATPFTIIGNSGYGKPILNRTLEFESSIRFALKTGFLSFDSTRVSANDVGFPLDVVILNRETGKITERRFEEEAMEDISKVWGEELSKIIKNIPESWIDEFNKSPNGEDKTFISFDQ